MKHPDKLRSRYSYSIDNLIKTLIDLKGDFAIYTGYDYKEVISANARHMGGGKVFRKYLFMFDWVRKDADNYIREHPDLEIINVVSGDDYYINFINQDNIDKSVISGSIYDLGAVDIKQAYWYTAYKMGIISEKTFKQAEKKKIPSNVLHTLLGSMGYTKTYVIYEKGRRSGKKYNIEGCALKQTLYRMIIIELDRVMMKLAQSLKSHFYAYKTDCIYFEQSLISYVEWFICKEGYVPVELGIRNVKVDANNKIEFLEVKKNEFKRKTLQ